MASPVCCVFSPHDLDRAHTGIRGNAPEQRKTLVQQALRRTGSVQFTTVATPEPDLALASCVHSQAYLQFLATAWDTWVDALGDLPNGPPIMDEQKLALALEEKGLNVHLNEYCSFLTEWGLVPAYVVPRDNLQKPSKTFYGQLAYYAMDRETPITRSTFETLRYDLSVIRRSVTEVEAYASGTSGASRVVYAQVTYPGHHAGPECYGGFCFVNVAAVTATLLRKTFAKVAVIDVDYHHGNGTMACFWNDPSVYFASLHADPESPEYPFTSGFADQTGGPLAPLSTLNIPLPKGTDWQSYAVALRRAIDGAIAFGAQALVVSLGLDTIAGDPVAYKEARFELLPPDFAPMGNLLLREDLQVPTIVLQEGGYVLSAVPQGVAAFLTGEVLEDIDRVSKRQKA
jgi:acetoin utilization deacetylase AcuC-like enzyme